MKAKVIETGEIIDVQCFYPVTYSRLDCNGKIVEEYDEYEIELIRKEPKVKMVSLDKVLKWFNENLHMYNTSECKGDRIAFVEDFKKAMEE